MCPWKQNRNRKKILTFHTCLCFDMIHCAPINHQYWSWRRGDLGRCGTSNLIPGYYTVLFMTNTQCNLCSWKGIPKWVQLTYYVLCTDLHCTTGCVTSGSTSTTFTGVVQCIYTGEHDFLNIIINSCLWDGSQQKKIFVMITLKYVRDVI